jgi:hypothetical protein
MPNAITMLKADHASLRRLLRELSGRHSLLAQIERKLQTHERIEEEVFYPAFQTAAKGTDAEELFYEATEEHRVVEMILPTLKAAPPKSPEFKARAKVLKDLIEHHIQEEETRMFAAARQLFDEDQLRALGERMQSALHAGQPLRLSDPPKDGRLKGGPTFESRSGRAAGRP